MVSPPADPPREPRALPRLVIAAPGSGHGKTTVATGLMGALCREGLQVAGFKVGPDYIDPGYHALATGRPSRNLDPHLCHPEQMAPLLLRGAEVPSQADVALIEGVMGLFDGQIGGEGFASTAHVAGLLHAPIVLVLDIGHVSRTAAAIVHGLNTFDPAIRLSGVILNKSGSSRHAREIVAALAATGLPVLGVLPRDAGIEAPSRHLGLVPAAERADAAQAIDRLAVKVAEHVDLRAILEVAHAAPPLDAEPWDPYAAVRRPSVAARSDQPGRPGYLVQPDDSSRPVVAIAAGRAFTFRYAETDELLRAAGCEPVTFDPTLDEALPEGTAGLYLGGGFPEVHAVELAANAGLRNQIADAVAGGLPTVAECAGLLYLSRSVDEVAMVGALAADAAMTGTLTLRYRTLVAAHDHLLAEAGTRVTGHEFHRTAIQPGTGARSAWLVDGEPSGFSADPAGIGRDTVHASYLHVHWAGHPRAVQRFADAVHAYAGAHSSAVSLAPPRPEPDLRHHGDSDLGEGLIDFAVNVRVSRPPAWLIETINATTPRLAAYPRTDEAVKAIAEAHGVDVDQVLPTAGGAEAFTLVARATRAVHPVVVHPQFTEPEVALRAAGHAPERVILDASDGFRLHVDRIPKAADLVMIGNPTNPTGTLHSADLIRTLLRPGRVVVVDEAFMDAIPGQPQTMARPSMNGGSMSGLLVLRSLTKTWGLAGLRAGYVIGDPDLVALLRAQQPPWSVSTPALAATVVCLAPAGLREAEAAAQVLTAHREDLVRRLAEVGLVPAGAPQAPFVLVDTHGVRGSHDPGWVRHALREQGFAVRRGDTFPGLGPDWIRIAARDPESNGHLVAALAGTSR